MTNHTDSEILSAIERDKHASGYALGSATLTGLVCAVLALGLNPYLTDTLIFGPKWTLWLWPPNQLYIVQFAQNKIAKSDALSFVNSTAITSAIYLIWLLGRLAYEMLRNQRVAFSREIFVAFIILSCISLTISIAPFKEYYSRHTLSLEASVWTNTLHVVVIIGGVYACVGEVLAKIITFLRIKIRAFRET